jgi:hypothetical protein
MIDLTVNLPNDETVGYSNLAKGGVQEVIDAAKLLHPHWTSLVIVLVKPLKERT